MESSCLILRVLYLNLYSCIQFSLSFIYELLKVSSVKVHKFSLCSTEEIWLDTEMASEIKIQGCFYNSSYMFLIFFHIF